MQIYVHKCTNKMKQSEMWVYVKSCAQSHLTTRMLYPSMLRLMLIGIQPCAPLLMIILSMLLLHDVKNTHTSLP